LNINAVAAKGPLPPQATLAANMILRSVARGASLKRGRCWGGVPIREEFDGPFMQIIVRDNNVDQALRALKKKLQREGVYREMKLRRHYEKPSEKRARERAAAIRRARKLERKRAEREGSR